MALTYEHKVYGRVSGRYRTELRTERREVPEPPREMASAPSYLAPTFRVKRHKRGNP